MMKDALLTRLMLRVQDETSLLNFQTDACTLLTMSLLEDSTFIAEYLISQPYCMLTIYKYSSYSMVFLMSWEST